MSLSREQAFDKCVQTDNLENLKQLLAAHPEQNFPTFNQILLAVEHGSLLIVQHLFEARTIEKDLRLLWRVNFNERKNVNDFIIEFCLKEHPHQMYLRKGEHNKAKEFKANLKPFS